MKSFFFYRMILIISFFFYQSSTSFVITSRPRPISFLPPDEDMMTTTTTTMAFLSGSIGQQRSSSSSPTFPDGRYALDINCGTGDTTAMLHRSCPNLRVIGIEKNANMWRIAMKRYPSLFFYYGNILHMDFFVNNVDVIQIPFKNFHPDSHEMIHKLKRMLSYNGEIRIIDQDTMKIILRFTKSDISNYEKM